MNNNIPSWDTYRKRNIPTSDPSIPEEEVKESDDIVRTRICKVCRKELAETEAVTCEKCGHYCHAECSSKFEITTYCNLCIIKEAGTNKRSFKALYGLMKGYKQGQIEKAAKFTSTEFKHVKTDLVRSDFLRIKRMLCFDLCEITYRANEMFPILEEIYSKEKDVQKFISELETQKSTLGFKLPSIKVTPGTVLFGMLALVALLIMMALAARILSFMQYFGFPGDAQLIFSLFMLFVTLWLVFKIKGWFG